MWSRLSNTQEPATSLDVLERSLYAATSCPPKADPHARYEAICSHFGEQAVLVIDDMPRLLGDHELSEHLIILSDACHRARIHLVTTSPFPLPSAILERLHDGVLLTLESPLCTQDDTHDILVAHGAPEAFLSPSTVSFLSSICEKNITLLAATAHYLRDRHWQLSDSELNTIAGQNHLGLLNTDTQARLLHTVTNDTSRELLARLSQIVSRFKNEEVAVVAGVSPAIAQPIANLNPLIGPWIQLDSEGDYAVSPIAQSANRHNLTPSTITQVNLALGEHALRRSPLNQGDAFIAMLYFGKARAHSRAAQLLTSVYLAMQQQGIPAYDAGLLSLWSTTPLPTEIVLGGRLVIRGLQTSLCSQAGKPNTSVAGSGPLRRACAIS